MDNGLNEAYVRIGGIRLDYIQVSYVLVGLTLEKREGIRYRYPSLCFLGGLRRV